MILTELKKRHVESDLRYRSSSLEEFSLTLIHPLLLSYPVLQVAISPFLMTLLCLFLKRDSFLWRIYVISSSSSRSTTLRSSLAPFRASALALSTGVAAFAPFGSVMTPSFRSVMCPPIAQQLTLTTIVEQTSSPVESPILFTANEV
jgi:hypothetical protein